MIELVAASSVLICAVMLLRVIFASRASRRLLYALWGLVLLRLCLPFGLLDSSVSVMNIFSAAGQPAAFSSAAPDGISDTGGMSGTDIVGGAETAGTAGAAESALSAGGENAENRQTITGGDTGETSSGIGAGIRSWTAALKPVLAAVWISGSAALGCWFLGSALVFRRRLKKSRAALNWPGCRLPVYVTPVVASPCLSGILRPAVYLTPRAASCGKAAASILAHECAHYRQGDHLWAAARAACLVVYWWHPLVWAAAALSRADSEMACDEAVVREIGQENRFDYGRTLVDMVAVKSPPAGILSAAVTMSAGSRMLKRRLRQIVKTPKRTLPAAVALVLSAVILAGCTFTGAQRTPDKSDEPPAVTDTDGGVSEYARTLYERRAPYIGDAPAVGRLLEALDIASTLGDYTMELQTSEEPYILRLTFTDTVGDGEAFNAAMMSNAVVLLALIDNASRIEWQYEFSGGMTIRGTEKGEATGFYTGILTEEDAAAGMNVEDIKAYGQSAEKVQELLENLPKTELGGETPAGADRTNLEACVSEAILRTNGNPYHLGDFACESHVTLKTVEEGSTVTVYLMVLHCTVNYLENGFVLEGGSHMPVAITFEKNDKGEYTLKEYWIPQDGSYYMPSIKEKFPPDITERDVDTQRYITQQMRNCYDQIVKYGNIETKPIIGRLFDTIASSPAYSSNPGDYIEAHPIEYRELLYYGDYTLRYVCAEFLKGGQTGLKGHLMRAVMQELLGEAAPDYQEESPQAWFDRWKADNEEKLADAALELQPGDAASASTVMKTFR